MPIDAGASLQQALGQLGARLQQVLAVVQNHQQLAIPNGFRHGFEYRRTRLFLHAQHGGHGLRHESRIRHRGKLDEPNAVRVLVQHLDRHLQREPRLS